MSRPTADVSVRVAWADDAPALAHVQLRAWRAEYADLVPAEGLPSDAEVAAQGWHHLLTRPADARQRVLVALEGPHVRGFVITAPASDPDCDPARDGELVDLTVDPEARRRGHGSRLLQAGIDTLRADRFTRATTWVLAHDEDRRAFLQGAGWGPDSARRELALAEGPEAGDDGASVLQVRLHTDLG